MSAAVGGGAAPRGAAGERRAGRQRLPALFSLAAALACDIARPAPAERVRAELGLFYGGQIQERDEIPLATDPASQQQGFRLTLTPAPAEALEVRWELGKPGQGKPVADAHGRKARPRSVQLGRSHFRPGEPVFEQTLHLGPGEPPGLWNLRVLVGGDVVLERPFVVYDPIERSRARPRARFDAGF